MSLMNLITVGRSLRAFTKPLCLIPGTLKFTRDSHTIFRHQAPNRCDCKFMLLAKRPDKLLKRNATAIKIEEKPSKPIYIRMWIMEQLMNLSLLALIPAAFLTDSKEVDMAMGLTIVVHSFRGVESMLKDYARANVVGKGVSKFLSIFLLGISAATIAGFYKLIYEDIGLANYIKKLWQIKVGQLKPIEVKNRKT